MPRKAGRRKWHCHVRPFYGECDDLDRETIWCVDMYDGRNQWIGKEVCLTQEEAKRKAKKLRRVWNKEA